MNYKAYTVMNTERIELSTLSDCDCVLYPTDSRGVDAQIAYNRVHNVCNLLKNDNVKCMPTGLTVHFAEISEVRRMRCWTAWREDYIAIVAPCFPASGRDHLWRIYAGGWAAVT